MSYEEMINVLQEILDRTEWVRLDRKINLERVIIELLKRKVQEEELLWE